jgi:hypothetical protein
MVQLASRWLGACLLCLPAQDVTPGSAGQATVGGIPPLAVGADGSAADCLFTYIDELSECRRMHCQQKALFWFTWEVCDGPALMACAAEAQARYEDCLKAVGS